MITMALALSADASRTSFFPFLFNINNMYHYSALVPVDRVVRDAIFDCPHPCGLMPEIDKNDGTITNGGIPQLMNRTLHFDQLTTTLDYWIARNDSRIMDWDWEEWYPIWERVNGTRYGNASVALVQEQHPEWTDPAQIEEQARKDWETAALSILCDTVDFIRVLRPSLRLIMYNYPQRNYWNGYDGPNADALREQNDRLMPLFCKLDVLGPTIYQIYNSEKSDEQHDKNVAFITTTLEEAARISLEVPRRCGRGRPLVYPYALNDGKYHGTDEFVCEEDARMYWELSSQAGADGIILWGYFSSSPTEPGSDAQVFVSWWNESFSTWANAWTGPTATYVWPN